MKNKKAVLAILVIFLAIMFTFAACKSKDNGVAYVTDANGVTILDANGEPITIIPETSVITITDGNGNVVTNANGEPETSVYYKPQQVPVPVTDSNKEIVTGSNGEVLTTLVWFPSDPTTTAVETVTVTDSSGNAVTDPAGNPVTETTVVSAANESYVKTMGGTGADEAVALSPAADGGVFALVSGNSKNGLFQSISSTKNIGFAVCRYSKDGTLLWTTAIGAKNSVFGQNIAATKDGGVVVVGQTKAKNFGTLHGSEYDAVLVKFDKDGNEVFRKLWGGTSNEDFYAVGEGNDGSIYAAGFAYSKDGDAESLAIPEKESRAVIVKFSANGDVQKAVGVCGFGDYFSDISISKSGDVFAVASLNSSSTQTQYEKKGASDAGVFKFNANLELQFGRSFGGSGIDRFEAIVATDDGGCVIAGASTSKDGDIPKNTGDEDAVIAKFSGTGSIVFVSSLAGNKKDSFKDVTVTPQGYIIAGGETSSKVRDFGNIQGDNKNAFVARFNINGELQAISKGIGGNGDDVCTACCITTTGQIIVAGSTTSVDGDFSTSNPKSDGTNSVAFIKTESF